MKTGDPGFWIDEIGRPDFRAALTGERRFDVVIVGAGYTGLWTAYYLKRAEPGLEVAVLERDFVGAGASGRNGGWVSGFFSGPPRLYDREASDGFNRLQRQMFDTVEEISRVLEVEGIEADWHKGGNLGVVVNVAQAKRAAALVESYRRRGFPESDFDYIDGEQLAGRLRIPGATGATWSPHVARVNPAKLVFGLAAAVERLGVEIFEGTPVREIAGRTAVTPSGRASAEWVIRATEAYTPSIKGMKRDLVPLNSSMIITAPLSEAEWAEIGWDRCETVHDTAHAYCYLQRTADGRIAIGGRGVPYRFGSPTTGVGRIGRRTVNSLRARLNELFPVTRGVEIDHGWSGILGVPRDWGISARLDRERSRASAGGYVGQGVAVANLSGRTLTDLILDRPTELAGQAWVGRSPGRWEPEPARYLAIRGAYGLYRLADRFEARSKRTSRLSQIVDKLTGRH